jgi:fimbrial chaperone protein
VQTFSILFLKRFIFLNALLSVLFSSAVTAGGVALGSTRIVYPSGIRQITLPVNNTDDKSRFLIKSWVENSEEKKTNDFMITPPLFMIGPGNENLVSIKFNGTEQLPIDRETLYWFNSQAIPQRKAARGENILQLATLSRIKIFFRPSGLEMSAAEAPQHIRFSRQKGNLVVHNPTPYYITLVGFRAGKEVLPNTMVAPKQSLPVSSSGNGEITFRTVNDYGALTPEQKGLMK